MKRNLKDQILALRQDGKTLAQIKLELQCSFSTVAYHLYHKTRRSTVKRVYNRRRLKPRTDWDNILYRKYCQFFRLGHYRDKIVDKKTFSFETLCASLDKHPVCYLTGRPVNLSDPKDFSLDHKLPVSRGGLNDLSNLGVASATANVAKNSLTESEFVELCTQVLIHHGYAVSKGT